MKEYATDPSILQDTNTADNSDPLEQLIAAEEMGIDISLLINCKEDEMSKSKTETEAVREDDDIADINVPALNERQENTVGVIYVSEAFLEDLLDSPNRLRRSIVNSLFWVAKVGLHEYGEYPQFDELEDAMALAENIEMVLTCYEDPDYDRNDARRAVSKGAYDLVERNALRALNAQAALDNLGTIGYFADIRDKDIWQTSLESARDNDKARKQAQEGQARAKQQDLLAAAKSASSRFARTK